MFKPIPGNHIYKINLSGDIKTTDGSECTLIINNNIVNITMYEKERMVDKNWLALVSHFEIELPEKYREELFHINFCSIKKTTNICSADRKISICGKSMVFRRPLIINGKYRIVPNFPFIAASKEGELINVITKEVLIPKTMDGGYPIIQIYNPDKGTVVKCVIHRLVALAWCDNKDPYNNSIVNHIDGDKNNPHAYNLEWCSYSHNAHHAFKTGLREDNVPCRVFDTLAQEEHNFHSVKEASRFMFNGKTKDISRERIETKRPNLIAGRYEIRLKGNDTPWFYTGEKTLKKIGKYIITVTNPAGEVTEFYDTRDLVSAYKLWNVHNINDQVNKFRLMYPEHKIEFIDVWGSGVVQALNIKTDKVTEAPNVLAMSRLINKPRSQIMKCLSKGESYVIDGYAYRRKIDKKWSKDFATKVSKSVCIQATNMKTQEVINLPSLREAAKVFNTDRSLIKHKIRTGKSLVSWVFKIV